MYVRDNASLTLVGAGNGVTAGEAYCNSNDCVLQAVESEPADAPVGATPMGTRRLFKL